MKIENINIKVVCGDITEIDAGAIVNAANNRLSLGGGVAGAIRKKGGPAIQEECNRIGPISIGEAAVTGAGKLKAKYVIHAATMGMDFVTNSDYIRNSFINSLRCAEEKKVKSVAFPALGCGVGGFPVAEAAGIMLEELKKHLRSPSGLEEVIFVLYRKNDYAEFVRAIGERCV
jgi:O-acetyl-ADP-ribose deacetylase (regulator of RNase III)